jgi:hypothetical protein
LVEKTDDNAKCREMVKDAWKQNTIDILFPKPPLLEVAEVNQPSVTVVASQSPTGKTNSPSIEVNLVKPKDPKPAPSSLYEKINKFAHLPVEGVHQDQGYPPVAIFPRLEAVISSLQTNSLFCDERKDLETIFWNQLKRLPVKPFAIYRGDFSMDVSQAVQELIFVIRERGSSNAPKDCKRLMVILSPEFKQWENQYDAYGMAQISKVTPEMCEYLNVLPFEWKLVESPIQESPHEA